MPACGPGLVTTTSTMPAACAPVMATIVVGFITFTLVAATPPTETVAPGRKSVPEIVIVVPPSIAPDVGEIDVTAGPEPDALRGSAIDPAGAPTPRPRI